MSILEGVAASDFHLQGLDKHFDDGDDRIIAEIDKIYQYCLTNGIKHFFMPGDMSDTPDIGWDTYGKLFMLLKKYDGKVWTYYIAGNHDFADIENTSMNFLELLARSNVFKTFKIYLKPAREVIDDVPVNFLPFPCLETLSKGKMGGLNFAHVEYSGAIGDNGRALKTKHELSTHKNDFTISGHIHQYQYMKAKRAVYCGNPFQKNFGESLPKGFVHFRAEVKGNRVDVEHKFVENKPGFTLQTVHVNDLNDFKKLRHDDSIRYRLIIDEEVPIPPDLRVKYPNITGEIRQSGKTVKHSIEEAEQQLNKPSINPRTGLKQFLAAEGLDKKSIKQAIEEVKIAQNKRGLAV